MNEEFNKEKELSNMLDSYKFDIPVTKLAQKQSTFQRFIRYLGSPSKDPLENCTNQSNGYLFFNIFPVVCGLFLAILQVFLLN
ncbi:hypothetical protein MKZ25_10090 [Solibacillus sp. FSL W7-1464]|uniref:hypothetical protein n=1 Tax=Solibacillus sp. FSL W7-1464 TaxID=2921706 RepID=UPI0030FC9FBE